jgi:hypothetical protein
MNTRQLLALILLGFMFGGFSHQYAPQNTEFLMYALIPTGMALDNLYLAIVEFNKYSWTEYYNDFCNVYSTVQFYFKHGFLPPQGLEHFSPTSIFPVNLLPSLGLPSSGYEIFSQLDVKVLKDLVLFGSMVQPNVDLGSILEVSFWKSFSLSLPPIFALPLPFNAVTKDFFKGKTYEVDKDRDRDRDRDRDSNRQTFLNFFIGDVLYLQPQTRTISTQ